MQRTAGLILALVGLLLFGSTVPLFAFVVGRAWSQGNMMASVSFIILVGVAGLVMMLIGWSLARRR